MFLDEQNGTIKLGDRVGSPGGEGITYAVLGRNDIVAKIYHNSPDAEKREKLIFQRSAIFDPLKSIASWPENILYKNGKIAGFLMRRIHGKSIHFLYRPDDRISNFPSVTWQSLVEVSRNVAAGFQHLHTRGVIMGDVNESNVFVTSNGEVRFIDCDSFQVQDGAGKIFGCSVFTAGWAPPELMKSTKSISRRVIQHDLFGLAVLIFHLLYMGKHPFAGVPPEHLLENPPSLEDLIKNNVFPYSLKQRGSYRPPPNFLDLADIPQNLSSLFERAFLSQNRPTASEWCQVLESIRFKKCQWGHVFYHDLIACPWCRIWSGGGGNFFVVLATGEGLDSTLGEIEKLIDLIEKSSFALTANIQNYTLHGIDEFTFQIPKKSTLNFPQPSASPFPNMMKERIGFIIGSIVALVAIFGFLYSPPAFILWIPLLWWGYSLIIPGIANPAYNEEIERRKNRPNISSSRIDIILQKMADLKETASARYAENLDRSQRNLRKLSDDMKKSVRLRRELALKNLFNLRDELKTFPERKKALQSKLLERAQLEQFLRKFNIPTSGIDQIGPVRNGILMSYGIYTAWDLKTMKNVSGLGAGEASLRAWLRSVELRFRPSNPSGLPATAEQEIRKKMREAEQEILRRSQTIRSDWFKFQRTMGLDASNGSVAEIVKKEAERLSGLNRETRTQISQLIEELKIEMDHYGQALSDSSVCPKRLKKWG